MSKLLEFVVAGVQPVVQTYTSLDYCLRLLLDILKLTLKLRENFTTSLEVQTTGSQGFELKAVLSMIQGRKALRAKIRFEDSNTASITTRRRRAVETCSSCRWSEKALNIGGVPMEPCILVNTICIAWHVQPCSTCCFWTASTLA